MQRTTPPALTRRAILAGAAGSALGSMIGAPAAAQSAGFPNKPVTLIVPLAAGGSVDVMARALATHASRQLGQQVVVVNRPGAGLTLGPSLMAKTAAPDGYTVAMLPTALFSRPHLQKVDFSPLDDFTYIIHLVSLSYGIIAMQNARWKTLAELIAEAKANPGKINYGTSGYGSSSHIAMEQFSAAAGVKFTPVAFKGASETFNALYGGHIDFAVEGSLGTSDTSRVRLLASPMGYRINRWPDVPTLKELGYDVVGAGSFGLGGPKGMAPAVVQRIHDAFKLAMAAPDFVQIVDQNANALTYMNGADYASYGAKLYQDFGRTIQSAGIKLE